MTDARNELLLSALKRAGEPLDSDALLNQASELALDHFWTPDHLTGLSRKGVAKRCRDMAESGVMNSAGVGIDAGSRRTTPKYAPVGGYEPQAPVPQPPELPAPPPMDSAYAAMHRIQLLAVLDAHDDVLECVSRFLREMTDVRERARRRLIAADLVER